MTNISQQDVKTTSKVSYLQCLSQILAIKTMIGDVIDTFSNTTPAVNQNLCPNN